MKVSTAGHCASFPEMRVVKGDSYAWFELADKLSDGEKITIFFDAEHFDKARDAAAAFNAAMSGEEAAP